MKSHAQDQVCLAGMAVESLRCGGSEKRTRAIMGMARSLREHEKLLLDFNRKDMARARAEGVGAAKLDRLRLTPGRIEEMARGIEAVAEIPDPVGRVVDQRVGPSGIRVQRVRVPIGVILMIYEARPNVTAEAAALCVRAGNAVLLHGGHEAMSSNLFIEVCLRDPLADLGISPDAVQTVAGHVAVDEMLKMEGEIQLVIPRGGEGLIRAVAEKSRIPVIKHYKGNCHVYVDAAADEGMAIAVAVDAKAQRPATCNAAEKLLVHEAVASRLLPRIAAALRRKGVRLKGDWLSRAIVPSIERALKKDWDEEYLDLVMAVKVVKGLDEAIAHINRHGSAHTDAIITKDESAARRFLSEVDSSSVMWNCSTRLADGGQYGMGAEIGISTDRIHARGPMGVEELTCLKWVVTGDGQLRGGRATG